MRRLRILDSTLRDGDQTAVVSFSAEQKIRLAKLLDECGVDCIEAGFPCSSEREYDACSAVAHMELRSDVAVMSRCLLRDIEKSARVFSGMADTSRAVLHLTVPVSDVMMRVKLHQTRDEVRALIRSSVLYAASFIKKIEIGFEDATRADHAFLVSCCRTAAAAGASVINIADTAGCLSPGETGQLFSHLLSDVPPFAGGSVLLSVHCHNDRGLALACTLAAVSAGASQAEVTAAGLGERCGNTPLEELAYAFLAPDCDLHAATGLKEQNFGTLLRTVFTYCSTDFSPIKPVTGWNTDTHASGLHQQGLCADPETYIAAPAEPFGLVRRRIVLNSHSGKAGLARTVALLTNGTVRLQETETQALLSDIKRSAEPEIGVTALCTLLYAHNIVSYKPVLPAAVAVVLKKGTYRVTLTSGRRRACASSSTLESAVLKAVHKLYSAELVLQTVSLSRYSAAEAGPAATKVYAEILDPAEGKLYTFSSVAADEAAALYACLLDAVNAVRLANEIRHGRSASPYTISTNF